MTAPRYDLIVLGGGPGGYAAAIRAAQLGLTVALIEQEGLGGTCLHHGCIPSKALLHSAQVLSLTQKGSSPDFLGTHFARAIDQSHRAVAHLHQGLNQLIKNNKIAYYPGYGHILSQHHISVTLPQTQATLEGNHLLIATGSRVTRAMLSTSPIEDQAIYTSDEALKLRTLPESVAIIGGGPTGCEFASLYAAYGVRVTLIERASSLLPSEDVEISSLLEKHFKRLGICVCTGTSITDVVRIGTALQLSGPQGQWEPDALLIAAGRIPNTDCIGLEALGLAMQNGRIVVDEQMHTNCLGVDAVGDVTTRPAFAHGAMAYGIYVAESLAGKTPLPVDRWAIPTVVYCQPEVASVGMTDVAAREAGIAVRVGRCPFSANGKAVATGMTEGFVKVVLEAESDRILGAQIIGPHATELIGSFVLARTCGLGASALKRAIYPHPTLSEAVHEAIGDALGEAIHLLRRRTTGSSPNKNST